MLKKTLLLLALVSATTVACGQNGLGGGSDDSRSSDRSTPSSTTTDTSRTSDTNSTSSTPNRTGAVATQGAVTGETQSFATLDGNGDGKLSRDEVRSVSGLDTRFGQLDTDYNGSLSDAEFSQFEVTDPAKSDSGYDAGAMGSDDVDGTKTPDTITPDSDSKVDEPSDTRP